MTTIEFNNRVKRIAFEMGAKLTIKIVRLTPHDLLRVATLRDANGKHIDSITYFYNTESVASHQQHYFNA